MCYYNYKVCHEYSCGYSSGALALVTWWEHLFVCITKFGLIAEAPLNEMTDNGAHTAKKRRYVDMLSGAYGAAK